MNQPQGRNWWDRNWKWFVPVGCLGSLILFLGFIAAIMLLVFGMMKSSDAYKNGSRSRFFVHSSRFSRHLERGQAATLLYLQNAQFSLSDSFFQPSTVNRERLPRTLLRRRPSIRRFRRASACRLKRGCSLQATSTLCTPRRKRRSRWRRRARSRKTHVF